MAQLQFKRKRKSQSKSRQRKETGEVLSAKAGSAKTATRDLGMSYKAGPVFPLSAVTPEAADNDEEYQPVQDADSFERGLLNPPPGEPLDTPQRKVLERRFGRSFAGIQIHTGHQAGQFTDTFNTRAFACRQHIWLARHADKHDNKLIAHELAHVAQQGYAPPLQRAPIALTPVSLRAGDAGTGRPATEPAEGVAAPTAPATTPAGGTAGSAVQGFELWDAAVDIGSGIVSTAADAVEYVTEIPGNLAEMGFEAAKRVLRRFVPNFLAFFENDGVTGLLNRVIERGVESLFSGILGAIERTINIDEFASGFDEATSWLGNISGQISANACNAILRAACHVREFFADTFGPVIDKISGIACQVKGFLNGIWESIGAPVWEFLRNVGGEIWEGVQAIISDAADLIRSAKDALGDAWDTVKEWLGIEAEEGEGEGGGLWEWIREKASEIGESVAEFVRPVMGPLRDAAGVLLLFVPGGQIFAVMALWPRLRQAFDWISEFWSDLNLIPRARAFLTETVFPWLMDAAETMAQTMLRNADWMIANISRLVDIIRGVVDGVPSFLMPMRPVVSFMLRLFQKVLGFARSGIRYVSNNFRSLVRRLLDFIQLVGRVLVRIISIVINPFGLIGFLVGTLWQLLPDCIKGPLINFILDILIGFIRAIPSNPLLGILWPVVKNGFLGFLETVRALELDRKVRISDKVANIIAGGSPSFIVGYFTGIIAGLWEAITSPIQAIVAIFQLPSQIQEFLSNLGVRLCEIIDKIRCFARNLASQVFGSVDSVLTAIQEFLSDPARIISIIRCAIQGVLSGARELGSQMATQMIGVFEGPDEAIGRALGNITGQILFQVVLGFFTAGAGTAVSSGLTIVNRIAAALRTIGRAIGTVMRVLRGLFGRLISFMRGLASKFGQAIVRGGRSVLGRLGGFFRRFTRWLARIGRRMFRAVRRRFGLSPAQRIRWGAFNTTLRGNLSGYSTGIRKSNLRQIFGRVRRQFRDVAKWPSFITKHGPYWRLWVRRVKSIRPRKVVDNVLLDPRARLRAGMRAVRREARQLKRREEYISTREIQSEIRHLIRRYRLVSLDTTFNQSRNRFEVSGRTNPTDTTYIDPPRPDENEIIEKVNNRSATAIVTKKVTYNPPSDPPMWSSISRIKVRSGRSSLYIRGHIISGHLAGGNQENIMPISRVANARMLTRMERTVKNLVKGTDPDRPVLRYRVRTTPPIPGSPPKRKIGTTWMCVPEEKQMVSGVIMTLYNAKYDPDAENWHRTGRFRKAAATQNVPRLSGHHSHHNAPHIYPIGKSEGNTNNNNNGHGWC